MKTPEGKKRKTDTLRLGVRGGCCRGGGKRDQNLPQASYQKKEERSARWAARKNDKIIRAWRSDPERRTETQYDKILARGGILLTVGPRRPGVSLEETTLKLGKTPRILENRQINFTQGGETEGLKKNVQPGKKKKKTSRISETKS